MGGGCYLAMKIGKGKGKSLPFSGVHSFVCRAFRMLLVKCYDNKMVKVILHLDYPSVDQVLGS